MTGSSFQQETLNKKILKTSLAGPLLMGLVALAGTSAPAYALPQGGTVTRGQADIAVGPGSVDVTQHTDRAVLNWGSFDIAAGERVSFAQPSAKSVTLNRISGGQGASQIFGLLTANGTILLVNPQGVVFGAGSQVNVGGLIATTADIADDKFMAGDMSFDKAGDPSAIIINEGSITAAEGGLVALIAPEVKNSGIIQAKLGRVQLASGEVFTVDLYGDGLIRLQASDAIVKQVVANSGTIEADGGNVLLTAAAAQATLDSLINMDGIIKADSVGEKNGHVVLYAEKGETRVAGTISAQGKKTGETGGKIDVSGRKVVAAQGAVIDASGKAGGGAIRMGGDVQGTGDMPRAQETLVEDGAKLLANALEKGDGGKIIVWGDERAAFGGEIEAKGGVLGGKGGFVETSGANLDVWGSVDAGVGGSWLLDPENIHIRNKKCSGFFDCIGYNVVQVSSLENTLNKGSTITLRTSNSSKYLLESGTITIENSITKTAGANASLILEAHGDIVLDEGVKISSSAGQLGVKLNADIDTNDSGDVILKKGSSILTNGGMVALDGAAIKVQDSVRVATSGGAVTMVGSKELDLEKASILTSGGAMTFKGVGSSPWTGGISLKGTTIDAGGGTIFISGKGYGSTLLGASYGVWAEGATIKTSGYALIRIEGTGGNSGVSLTGLSNYGVSLKNTTVESLGMGSVTITGTGGDSKNLLNVSNYGVKLDGGRVASAGGELSVTGKGGKDISLYGVGNDGIILTGGAVVTNTKGGVTLTGVAGVDKSVFGSSETYGVRFGGTATIGGAATTGAITVVTDTLAIKGCSSCVSVQTTGNATFKTYSADTSIGVAGGVGTLQITKALLGGVKAGTVTIGDLNKGAGKLTASAYDWSSDAVFLTNTGEILIAGQQKMGSETFLAQSKGSKITLGASGSVTSEAAGTAVTLAASNGAFINLNGANAIKTPNGRWLVYSNNPSKDTMGGLVSDFRRYSCTYGGACPSFSSESGNGNLYAYTPILTVKAEGGMITYGDKMPALYSISGFVNGDAAELQGAEHFTFSSDYSVGSGVGVYNLRVIGGTFVSGLGYAVAYDMSPATVVVTPAKLTVRADNQTVGFGAPLPKLTYTADGFVNNEDAQIFTGGLTTNASIGSAYGLYEILQGSLAAGENYKIDFTAGTMTIAAPADAILAAEQQGKIRPLAARGLGYNGILLAMTQNAAALGSLAPAAGGSAPMSAVDMANLSPAAGGVGAGGILPLITCDDEMPCSLIQ